MSTHLNILAIEAMLFHFERKTLRPHNPTIHIGFKLDALKGVQVMLVAVLIHVNQIWSLQNLCVAVDDGWNDVPTVKSDKPLMKLILGQEVKTLKC